jgi:RNA polymerase sigma factor (TIGR02999 family)
MLTINPMSETSDQFEALRAEGAPALQSEELVAELYTELRRLARRLMSRERGGGTLQPTALIHEVYLKLCQQDGANWTDRNHFMAVACQSMRRILVDHARRRGALKRGRPLQSPMLDSIPEPEFQAQRMENVIAVDELLTKLAGWDSGLAKLVELRYFGGLTTEEAAVVLGNSYDQARRDWTVARAWFRTELQLTK